MEEMNCKVCTTQGLFEDLVELGMEEAEAFHVAVTLLLENTIEDAVETSFEAGKKFGFEAGLEAGIEEGYEIGYKEACGDLAEIVGSYAESLED